MAQNVSAWDFDNTYEYFEEADVAVIHNCDIWIGFCLNQGEELARLKLTWGDTKVPVGTDVHVGTFELTLLTENNTDFFDSLDLIDLKNGQTMTRGKQYKVKTYFNESVDDYENVCNDVWNETNQNYTSFCSLEEIGSHIELKSEWVSISNPNFEFESGKTYEVGVFVDVEFGDYGDWIPSLMGVNIEEWATWEADLINGIQSYFKLDQLSGAVIDETGNWTPTNNGATRGATGLINKSFSFSTNDWVDTDMLQGTFNAYTEYTIAFWFKLDSDQDSWLFDAGNTEFGLNFVGTSSPMIWSIYNGGFYNVQTAKSSWNTDQWYQVVLTYDSVSGKKIYIDGVLDNSSTNTINTNAGDAGDPLEICRRKTSVGYVDGDIDEWSTWDRDLSAEEVDYLYDSQLAGCSYNDDTCAGTAPQITLVSPADGANTTSSTQEFSATVTDDLKVDNVSLVLDGVINQTNTSGVNGSYLFTVTGILEGPHNWSIIAIDNQSFSNQSENRSFNLTIPAINIDLLSPSDASTWETPVVNVTCIGYENDGVTQLNITINGVTNVSVTNSTPGENLTAGGNINFNEGNYTWGCSALNPTKSAISANRTFEVLYSSPVIALGLPNDTANLTTQNVNFTFNATDANGITNVSLFIDGVLNDSNTSGISGMYYFNKIIADGQHNWSVRAVSIYNKTTDSATRTFEVDTNSPVINLTAPPTVFGKLIEGTTLNLNWTVSDLNLDSCWYVYPQTSSPESNETVPTGSRYNLSDGSVVGSGSGDNLILYDQQLPSGQLIISGAQSTNGVKLAAFTTNVETCTDKTYTTSVAAAEGYACARTEDDRYFLVRVYNYNVSAAKLNSYDITYDVTCGDNTTTFSYIQDNNDVTFFANDTIGNVANESRSWTVQLAEGTQTFPTDSVETKTETYTASITYNSSAFLVATAVLELDGTTYTGTRVGSGDTISFTADAIMPSVDTPTNFTATWTVSLTDENGTTDVDLTSNNVTVDIIDIGLCGIKYNVSFWNFTILNETNFVEINSTFEATYDIKLSGSSTSNYFNFSDVTGNTSQYDFCLYPPTESFVVDTVIDLTKPGFVTKTYNFENVALSNTTREDNLYMMVDGDSTTFIVHVVDVASNDITEAEVRVQRYYPGTNEWLTTEIITTNYEGKAVGHILENDASYRFRVYQDGVSVYNSSATKITCSVAPCTVTLVIPISIATGIEEIENLESSLTYNTNTNTFTYSYSDTSGSFSRARLYVVRLAPSNASIIMPCNTTKFTSDGVITCDISGQVNGTYQASAYITRTGSAEALDKRINGVLGTQIYDSMGDDGVLWSIFIFIGIVMIGAARPSLGILFGMAGFIVLALMGTINIGAISIVAVSAIGIILLVRVGRE